MTYYHRYASAGGGGRGGRTIPQQSSWSAGLLENCLQPIGGAGSHCPMSWQGSTRAAAILSDHKPGAVFIGRDRGHLVVHQIGRQTGSLQVFPGEIKAPAARRRLLGDHRPDRAVGPDLPLQPGKAPLEVPAAARPEEDDVKRPHLHRTCGAPQVQVSTELLAERRLPPARRPHCLRPLRRSAQDADRVPGLQTQLARQIAFGHVPTFLLASPEADGSSPRSARGSDCWHTPASEKPPRRDPGSSPPTL